MTLGRNKPFTLRIIKNNFAYLVHLVEFFFQSKTAVKKVWAKKRKINRNEENVDSAQCCNFGRTKNPTLRSSGRARTGLRVLKKSINDMRKKLVL